MKKFKRFRQSYKNTINSMIDDHVYPSTRYHLRKQIAWAFDIGEMFEWVNDVQMSSKILYQDLKGNI